MAIPERLLPLVENFEFYPDREKVSGRMYGGEAIAILGDYEFHLKLWHHGSDNETKESLLPHLCIKSLIDKYGQYFDSYWHFLWSDSEAWLHPSGWFNDSPVKSALQSQFGEWFPNSNAPQKFDSSKFAELGFIRIW